jgi:FkbM family methyltransferase
MHVDLLMVGAHNGSKQEHVIIGAASRGIVILVEPVPFLFNQLERDFGGMENVRLERKCIAEKSGTAAFFAPNQDANNVAPWGDQLGSGNRDHALLHNPGFAEHISEIEVECITFTDLIKKYGITSIGTLFTDTEGFDATIIPTFPFSAISPDRIIFEYKHSDGVENIGRKLGMLLCFLDMTGYNIRVSDQENCIATLRK